MAIGCKGRPTHRVKVVGYDTGKWDWKRLGDIATGDLVPLRSTTAGSTQTVALPPLPEAYWTGEHHVTFPGR